MKGMKKLFALLAVLTMALTLTPMVAPVAAATVTLEPDEVTLFVGETKQLTLKVDGGAIGGNYYVSWDTASHGIATVNGNGVVTAVGVGETTVTATVKSGETLVGVAQAAITVVAKPTEPSELKATLDTKQAENLDPVINATVTFTTTTASVEDEYVLGVKITTDPALDGTTVNATLGGTASSASITSGATVITFTTSLNKISATAIQIGFYDGTNLLKLETATTVTVAILGDNSSTSTTIVEKAVTLNPHTLKLYAPAQILLMPGETKSFTITASLEKVDAASITASTATVVSANTGVVTATIENTATAFTLTATAGGNPGSTYVTVTVTVTYAGSEYTASVNIPVYVSQPAVGVSLYNANGSWVWAGSQLYYKVTYDVVGGFGTQNLAVKVVDKNGAEVGSAQLGQAVYVPYSNLSSDKTDRYLKLSVVGSTDSVTVPITFLSLDRSTFKDSYVSGEPIGNVTGTISSVGGDNLTSTVGLALVAVWKDAGGNTHAATVPGGVFTATRRSDRQYTATLQLKLEIFVSQFQLEKCTSFPEILLTTSMMTYCMKVSL